MLRLFLYYYDNHCHISIADKYGNVASMTTTVESAFGAFHMTEGFVLNNQLTDFSAQPVGPDGTPLANRVEPGKRPLSSCRGVPHVFYQGLAGAVCVASNNSTNDGDLAPDAMDKSARIHILFSRSLIRFRRDM